MADGAVLYLSYSTGGALSLKRDFEKQRVPVISYSLHASNLEDSNYIFLPIATYSRQMIGLAEYVANHHQSGKAKVALFIHPSAFGRGPVEDTKKAIEKGLNIEIVEVVEHGKDLDNTAMIMRLQFKGVQYVIAHTVQSPVATLLKGAVELGVAAKIFGEKGKLTFLGADYAGGEDLVRLAGNAAENFYWITGYRLAGDGSPPSQEQLGLGKRYGRDAETARSIHYTKGILVAQIVVESIRRVLESGGSVSRASIHKALTEMNGSNAYLPSAGVGSVEFSGNDHEGVETLQIYRCQQRVFSAVGDPIVPRYGS